MSNPRGRGPSIEEENRILAVKVDDITRDMLSVPSLLLPSSTKDIRAEALKFTKQIRQLEHERTRPHDMGLIHRLATAKAARGILRWRLFRINEFPNEILDRIFTLAVSSSPIAAIPKARARLFSVCSHWRSVIVNTPQLWSIIPIIASPSHLLNVSLERAKAYPLVLIVDQRDPNWNRSETYNRFKPEDMRALMSFIASFLDQVRELVVLADTWSVILAAQMILQSAPPPRRLQRLEFHRSGKAYVEFPAAPPKELLSPLKLFRGAQAPRLDHVSLEGVYIDFSAATFRNLRVFEMRKMPVEHMPSMENFCRVLQNSPQLEKLSFDGAGPRMAQLCDEKNGLRWTPVPLPRLRELTICNLVPEYAAYMLQLFSAPELRRLSLEKLIIANFTPVVEKLVGRFPKVSILSVLGLEARDTGMLSAWLMRMPVRYLKVTNVPDAFFEALLYRVPSGPSHQEQHRPIICPQLEVCEVTKWSIVNTAAFEKFYESRKGTLRKIIIPTPELEAASLRVKTWLRNTGILCHVPPGSRPDLNTKYEY